MAGEWAVRAPFLLWTWLLVVFGPGAVAVKVTDWAFSTRIAAVEFLAASALMALTVAGVWWAFRARRLAELLRLGRFGAVAQTSAVAVFAVASFASLTAVLYREGALDVRGAPIAPERVIDKTSELYAWHLVDSVPLLDIPSNLGWEQPVELRGSLVGLLVVCFTGVVVLPLVAAARLILAGDRDAYAHAVLHALRARGRARKVTPVSGRGYVVAEDGGEVLVDAVEQVWTEDAPLRRLALLAGEAGVAYLLVADAVGDRARERLEAAFAASEVPAALVVWRSDEPRRIVAEAVDALAARAATAAPPETAPAPAEAAS